MSDTNPNPKDPFLDSAKLKFSAPNPTGKGKYCQYYASVWQGNPRLVLQTNDPNEAQDRNKNFGRIEAPMDLVAFISAMELLRQLGEETWAAVRAGTKDALREVKYSLVCNTIPRGQGGPGQMPQPVLLTTVHIGRDAQGVIYMSNVSADETRPKVKVPLALPDKRFHAFTADRQDLDKPAVSALCAIAFAKIWSEYMPVACQRTYTPPVFGGGAGGSGGGNRNFQRGGQPQGGQRPYQSNPPARNDSGSAEASKADFGDDIPF